MVDRTATEPAASTSGGTPEAARTAKSKAVVEKFDDLGSSAALDQYEESKGNEADMSYSKPSLSGNRLGQS